MVGIGAPILIFVVLGIIVLSGINSMVRTNESVAHTHEVLTQSSEIMKSMVDMETGMRGYLLSGDEVFLEPYQGGERNALQGITLLQELVSDNLPQVERLDEAWIIIRKWETEVSIPNIQMRNEIGITKTMEDVAIVVNEGLGKLYFDQVRVIMDQFDGEENRLMAIRVKDNEDTINDLFSTMWIVIATTITFGILLAIFISANIAKPLVAVTQVMRRFTIGDTNARISMKSRSDEVGVLADTFNMLAQQLSDKEGQLLEEIKERKEAELIANQANRAKSSFLSAMSHEIRTPLNGVLGMAQLLLKTDLDDHQKNSLNTILSSGQSLRSILNDVLDMGKIESGNIELEELVFDLEDMVKSLSKAYDFLSEETNLDYRLEMDLGVKQIILGDQTRLQQILRNLLSNSFKFTKRGVVSLAITKLKDNDPELIKGKDITLLIEVSDTGKGISKDRIDTIFNAFEQEDASITREFGGSGLGLAIVKRFCDLMGGSISVSSTLNKGTTFRVLLPFSQATKQDIKLLERKTFDITEQVMAPLKILVAEDNEVNAIISKGFLEAMGHSVIAVENGKLALDAVKRGDDIDAILMDVHMPVMDGVEATLAIRKLPEGKEVPIIAVTAEALRERVKLFLESGMDKVLTKPFTEDQLMRSLLDIFGSEDKTKSPDEADKNSISQSIEEFMVGDGDQMSRFIKKIPKDKADSLLLSAQNNLQIKMEELKRGVEAEDTDSIKLASHTIRGSAGSLYAMRISELARIIQNEYQDIDKVRSLMPLMNLAADDTINWWKSF